VLAGSAAQEGLEVRRDLPSCHSSPARAAGPCGIPQPHCLLPGRGSFAQLQPWVFLFFAPWAADAKKMYGGLLTRGMVRQVPREGNCQGKAAMRRKPAFNSLKFPGKQLSDSPFHSRRP